MTAAFDKIQTEGFIGRGKEEIYTLQHSKVWFRVHTSVRAG